MKDNMSITQKRLRPLIDEWKEKGISRVDIAHSPELNCETSTITKHYNGDRAVNSHYIIGYAKYFGVSADYLLGLSDVQTTNRDLSFVCDTIGFTEETVQALSEIRKNSRSGELEVIVKAIIDKYHDLSSTLSSLNSSNNEVQEKLEHHITKLKSLVIALKKKKTIKWSIRRRENLYNELDPIYDDIMSEYMKINEQITKLNIFEDILKTSIYTIMITSIEKYDLRSIYKDSRSLAEEADKEVSRILGKEINAFLNLENLCKYTSEPMSSTTDPWREIDGDY